MTLPSRLTLLAFSLLALPLAAEPVEFTLKTLTAQMKYDKTELVVSPGQSVKINFENGDDLPHNIVFCQPGTDTLALSMKQMDKPEDAMKRNWLPDDSRIWAHSKLLNPHEKEIITFNAPEKPGVYPYVCTFPGHALSMRGELKVFSTGEGLKDLKFKMYLGDWDKLPEFGKLPVFREGVIEDNLIQVKLDDYKNQFGLVYTGKFTVPKEGEHTFYLSSDDGSRILINGKKVVEYDGIHPAGDIKSKSIKLSKGEHVFKLEYFQAGGGIELFAAWKGPEFQLTPLSKWLHPKWQDMGSLGPKKDETKGMPLAVGSEPLIYRNFIAGAGNRSIGVGFPGGLNVAWSAERMNVALIWRGAFMDAARHWNSRGGGYQPPLGYDVLRPAGELALPLLTTTDEAPEWPALDAKARPADYVWKGYELDKQRTPTFLYEWHGMKVADHFSATGNGTTTEGKLIRTVKFSGEVPANTLIRIATGKKIEAKGDGWLVDAGAFNLDGVNHVNQLIIHASGAVLKGSHLVLPAKSGEFTVTYQWP
jgi:azurin